MLNVTRLLLVVALVVVLVMMLTSLNYQTCPDGYTLKGLLCFDNARWK